MSQCSENIGEKEKNLCVAPWFGCKTHQIAHDEWQGCPGAPLPRFSGDGQEPSRTGQEPLRVCSLKAIDLRVARGDPPLGAPTSAKGQAERRSNDGEASECARGNFTHLCSPAGACSSPRDASDLGARSSQLRS